MSTSTVATELGPGTIIARTIGARRTRTRPLLELLDSGLKLVATRLLRHLRRLKRFHIIHTGRRKIYLILYLPSSPTQRDTRLKSSSRYEPQIPLRLVSTLYLSSYAPSTRHKGDKTKKAVMDQKFLRRSVRLIKLICIQALGNKSQTMLILFPYTDLKGIFSSSTEIIVLPMEGHTDLSTIVLTLPVLTVRSTAQDFIPNDPAQASETTWRSSNQLAKLIKIRAEFQLDHLAYQLRTSSLSIQYEYVKQLGEVRTD
ncbi:hypothetical protein F511_32657 [Dorcoceras hygrometricum]|uniref:Uncharacterized protein n=1 Tax=Dorcoceras hygrometricum TaxID=472368 RepID=A0A2Z7CIY6_9LAMI|nr:hypothetical protein F511_32657 [Dorcoceras hygrometricum]